MSVNKPTISVLMPAYNAQQYLAQTVESVLAQTFRGFEFIIVDDGSTDRTPQMLAEYAARDERVRVLTISNCGISKACNAGLATCRGEFIARIDADDVTKPNRLEVQLKYMREHDLVACGSWHDLIDERGRFLKVLKVPVDDADIQREALKGHGSICNPTSMVRHQSLLEIGGYNEELPVAEDLDCWLRLGEIGKLGNIPESLTQYRLHSNSISEQKCQLERDCAKIACEHAWERRGIEGTFEAGHMWRPGKDRHSRHEFALEYGWWAFKSGEAETAKSYGWRAVRLKPWSLGGYQLVVAAVRRGGNKRAAKQDNPVNPGVTA